MHTCWDVLEIEPTTDKKTIKRAYTSLIKQYNPETQADKFQALRQAYEEALQFSQHSDYAFNQHDTEQHHSNAPIATQTEDVPLSDGTHPIDASSEISPDTQAQTLDPDLVFCDEVNTVWEDENLRYQQKEWERLFARDELLDLEAKEKLWLKMFGFLAFEAEPKLIYSHPNLLIFMVKSLDEIFHWSRDELRLQRYFDEESIQKVLYLVDSQRFRNNGVSGNPAFEAPAFQLKWVIIFIIALLLLTNIFEGMLKNDATISLGYQFDILRQITPWA
ncbi:hypothetical protein TDB9533_02669 [Thalassocella blandensis]|nr:hypothetical protein TDB9533_02669 [Thalassocella blandensis]